MTGVSRVKIPALDALKTKVERLGRTHQLVLEIDDGDAANKLAWLEFRRRHFLSLGGEMPGQLRRYVKAGIAHAMAGSDPNAVAVLLDDAAAGAKALVLLRFRQGGGDARPMWALLPETIRRKRARGAPYPTRIGWDTGKLYEALERARFRFIEK